MFALIFSAAIAVTSADGEHLLASGWKCRSPGWPPVIDRLQQPWPDDVSQRSQKDGCIPVIRAHRVNVIAFQGSVAFICEVLNTKSIGGPDAPSYYCTYVLTKHLKTLNGEAIADQTSKRSPSPGFFDNARALMY